MGSVLCRAKGSREDRSNISSLESQSNSNNSNSRQIPDLDLYESALRHDPFLRSFDNIVRDRTASVIDSVSETQSFSLDSLRHVTGSLVDINEQVVKFILRSKEDILNNIDLRDLVEEYFDSSSKTLAFYSDLDKCLKRINNSHIFIQLAIKRFEQEKAEPDQANQFSKTLRELDNFKSVGDPFTKEFFAIFHSVYEQQVSMLSKLQAKKKKLDRKLKDLKSYRKVSNVIFVAAFAAVVICSVVAAAIAVPPVVATLVAVSSAPLGSVGKWISSLWKSYEGEVKEKLELVFEMEIETFTAVKELDTIRALVEKLKVEIASMLFKAEFAVQRGDEVVAVSMAIDEIKKNLEVFMLAVDVLGKDSDKFSRDIMRARAVILQRIIKYPSRG